MSIRHMKKEIPGSHYFSFFALSNLLTQTCLHFCTQGSSSSENAKCTFIIYYYICLPLCAHILYFDEAKFSIKLVYLTVCACAGRARHRQNMTQYRWFSETRFGCFFEWKKVAKGVCNVAKLATLCISISPTTGWATGQTENTRCVNRVFKKSVPLKWICVNTLLTH